MFAARKAGEMNSAQRSSLASPLAAPQRTLADACKQIGEQCSGRVEVAQCTNAGGGHPTTPPAAPQPQGAPVSLIEVRRKISIQRYGR